MHTPTKNTESGGEMATLKYCTLLLVLFLCVSCASDLGHAKRSLQGTWEVNSIFSVEQDRSGPYTDGGHKETGRLGSFTFSEKEVTYSYTRLGKTYSGTSPWKLTLEMVPHSFFMVERYTLHLKDHTYDVSFGDRTSDAEQNARKIALRFIPAAKEDRHRCYYIMDLTKK